MAQILVIDDDHHLRDMYRSILERAEYDVIDAPNGEVGARLYRENLPDLILTDLFMPEQEGLQTIMELKKDFPGVKIIAISGGAQGLPASDFLRMAKMLGARRTLQKPVPKADLILVIREVLESD